MKARNTGQSDHWRGRPFCDRLAVFIRHPEMVLGAAVRDS